MNAKALNSKYGVKPAIVDNGYRAWVYCRAQELDIGDPRTLSLVRDLSVVMEQALRNNEWSAVSSNNLYWNATHNPIRVVMVPHPEDGTNVTLVNPQILKYGDWEVKMIEGCGSFPGYLYVVKRSSFARVSAYMLGETCFSPVCLDYGIMDFEEYDGQKLPSNLEEKLRDVTRVQHEIDHLDGIVILEKGIFYGKKRFAQKALSSIKRPFGRNIKSTRGKPHTGMSVIPINH